MNIAVIAGGTLGHINPAIILSKYLIENKHNVIFISSKKDTKYEIETSLPNCKIYYIDSKGLTKKVFKLFCLINTNIVAYTKIKKILCINNIDKVIGFGGFISGIGLYASYKLKKELYIHEQNCVMGRANKWIYKKSRKVFLTYPVINVSCLKTFVITGSPVYDYSVMKRTSTFKETNRILITSGSNGSLFINDICIKLASDVRLNNYEIYVITGNKYYDYVSEKINSNHVHILPHTSNMIDLLTRSSICITRAGSSTLVECLGSMTYPIIIPSPNVIDNHQYYNALYYTEKYFGIFFLEESFNYDELVKQIELNINKKHIIKSKFNSLVCDSIVKEMIN